MNIVDLIVSGLLIVTPMPIKLNQEKLKSPADAFGVLLKSSIDKSKRHIREINSKGSTWLLPK